MWRAIQPDWPEYSLAVAVWFNRLNSNQDYNSLTTHWLSYLSTANLALHIKRRRSCSGKQN
ncbi:hypothetical protein VCR19J5_570015 [Vibrio crassostreae]|nr:hypothetical protein VCR19J5_570015 [Vibrio crassostreae]